MHDSLEGLRRLERENPRVLVEVAGGVKKGKQRALKKLVEEELARVGKLEVVLDRGEREKMKKLVKKRRRR